jgi:hypothetical protein
MAPRDLDPAASRLPVVISLSLPEAIIAALSNFALIVFAFWWGDQSSAFEPSAVIVVVALAVGNIAVFWNGWNRARSIRSVRDHFHQARRQVAELDALIQAAEVKSKT